MTPVTPPVTPVTPPVTHVTPVTHETPPATPPAMPWKIVLDNIVLPEYERAFLFAAKLGGEFVWSIDAALSAARDFNIEAFQFIMDRVDVDQLSTADVDCLRMLCNRVTCGLDFYGAECMVLRIVGSRVPQAIDSDFILSRSDILSVIDLSVIDYVLAVGGPPRRLDWFCEDIIILGYPCILDWALSKGLMDSMRESPDDDTLAVIAGFSGQPDVIDWLDTNGFAIGRARCRDFRHSWEAYDWLFENNHAIDTRAEQALFYGEDYLRTEEDMR